jgi:hypothetical protein
VSRRLLASSICAAVLLLGAGASSASAFDLHVRFPAQQPHAGQSWPIKVHAERHGSGKPIHAAALYKFIFHGSVVATSYPSPNSPPCQGGARHRPWHFFGTYRDRLCFPQRAIGVPLTLRVVVRAGRLGTKHRDHDIVVRP